MQLSVPSTPRLFTFPTQQQRNQALCSKLTINKGKKTTSNQKHNAVSKTSDSVLTVNYKDLDESWDEMHLGCLGIVLINNATLLLKTSVILKIEVRCLLLLDS